MAKYSKKSQDSVKEAMHEMKKGKLKSGKSRQEVTNPKQAIAIGLSEAREKGAKVPKKAAGKNPHLKSLLQKEVSKKILNKFYRQKKYS